MEEELAKLKKEDKLKKKKLREVNCELKKLFEATKNNKSGSLEASVREFNDWYVKEGGRTMGEKEIVNVSKYNFGVAMLKCIMTVNKFAENACETEKKLESLLKKQEENIPVLSISDFKILKLSFDVVIQWTINALLLQGVGTMLEKGVERRRNDRMLFQILRQVVSLSQHRNVDTYGALVLGERLSYLLGGLIQICYSPASKKKGVKGEVEVVECPSQLLASLVGEEDKTRATSEQVEQSRICLEEMVEKTRNMGLLVSSLMELMSSLSGKNCPKWAEKVCSTLLSRILLRPLGATAVLSVLLHQDSSEEYHLGHFVNAAMLVVTVPRQASSVQHYYSLVCPQLIPMLTQNSNPNFHKSVSIIIEKMLAQNFSLTKKYLMEPVQAQIIELVEPKDKEINAEEILCTHQDLESKLEIMRAFLQHSQSSQLVLDMITPAYNCLVKIYCFAHNSKSGVKQKCKNLLATFLRVNQKANKIIKSFLLPSFPSHLKSNSIVTLAPSPEGGVLVKRTFKK